MSSLFLFASGLLRLALVFLLAALAGACVQRQFEAADQSATPQAPGGLASLGWSEYYTGVVFNGRKIGFGHLRLVPEADGWRLESEATMALRVLGLDKRVVLRSVDHVDADLRLLRFEYSQLIDDAALDISGEVRRQGDEIVLVSDVRGAGGTRSSRFVYETWPIPMSAIYLAPTLAGLEVGRSYGFSTFSGELQTPQFLTQRIEGYEDSPLFLVREIGPGYRMTTGTAGQEVVAWVAADGRPLLERSLGGIVFAGLEPEAMARRYIAEAALSKDETLMDFALVPVAGAPQGIRGADRTEVRVTGLPADWVMRAGAGQSCEARIDGFDCRVRSVAEPEAQPPAPETLISTMASPSLHPRIIELARRIGADAGGGAARNEDRIDAVLAWMGANIVPSPNDVFSAIDVLDSGSAECQGHTYLYTALARALEVPTRVVNGLVWSQDHAGYLYHTWAESWIDEGWVAVDPTFGQFPADAGRIRLLDGEGLAALLPLTSVMGRVGVEVRSVH